MQDNRKMMRLDGNFVKFGEMNGDNGMYVEVSICTMGYLYQQT